MAEHRFEAISRVFAGRRLTRRQAVAASGAGLAAMAAGVASTQEATPVATPGVDGAPPEKTMYLFVQTYHSGSIIPVQGSESRYTVTLEQGSGQTIYFGDRPSRDVDVTPTPDFLQALGFPEDNPPNAALIVETETGETDIAVVELFNPAYDGDTGSVTYDVEVLQNWQEDLELGLREEPADLATLASRFGTAHLLIDDCTTDGEVQCVRRDTNEIVHRYTGVDFCWNYATCLPCEPFYHEQPDYCATPRYWSEKCNLNFSRCEGKCGSLVPVSIHQLGCLGS